MIAISQLSSCRAAPAPNTLAAKSTKIVFGSTSAAFPSAVAPSTITNATGIIV